MHCFLRNYRATPHATTGMTPAELLLRRTLKTKGENKVLFRSKRKRADTQKVNQVNVMRSLVTSIRKENKMLRNDFESLAKEIKTLLYTVIVKKVKSKFPKKSASWQNNKSSNDHTELVETIRMLDLDRLRTKVMDKRKSPGVGKI